MRLVRYIGAAVVAIVVGLVPAPPASAHDGPVVFDVAGDGAGGVTVLATFEKDKHPVEDMQNLVVTATGEGGRTVGPIQLRPTGEGRGFYSSGNVLTPGAWEVTVTAGEPHPGRVTAKVSARVAQTPPAAQAGPGLMRDENRAGRPPWLWWALGSGLVLVLLGLILRFRRGRPDPAF